MSALKQLISSFSPSVPELILLGVAALLLLIVLALRVFRKRHTRVPAIEYYSPEGMNPAEVSYVIDRNVPLGHMVSLLYYWASHKHLAITMREDGTMKLDYLSDLEDSHPEYERRLFADLWRVGTEDYSLFTDKNSPRVPGTTSTELSPEALADLNLSVNRAYRSMRESFDGSKTRRLTVKSRDKAAIRLPALAIITAMLAPFVNYLVNSGLGFVQTSPLYSFDLGFALDIFPYALGLAIFVMFLYLAASHFIGPLLPRGKTFVDPTSLGIGSFALLFILLYPLVIMAFCYTSFSAEAYGFTGADLVKAHYPYVSSIVSLLFFFVSGLFEKAHYMKSVSQGRSAIFTAAGWLSGIACSALYLLCLRGYGVDLVSMGLLCAAVMLCIALSPGIRSLTEYGAGISARCEGFRQFLLTAEKDRLEMLLEENPNYYYDVLPYAHALGVSGVWLEKTDGLDMKIPGWFSLEYPSSNKVTSVMMNTLESLGNSIKRMTVRKRKSAGGKK